MKIPYWDSTITLYRKQTAGNGEVTWSRSVHHGCFWKRTVIRDRQNGAEFKIADTVCRIPAPYPDVRIGDIIIHGSVTDAINEYVSGARSVDLLKKYAGLSMLVSDVHQNPRKILGIDHLYAGG